MTINCIDYLVYSSHKTSTQSMVHTLKQNKYCTIHCHDIGDLKIHYPKFYITPKIFIESLINYKKYKGKLKIISIIRDPKERLVSSFFQLHHTDEIDFKKKKEHETTISRNNVDILFNMYANFIKNNTMPRKIESLDELALYYGISFETLKNTFNTYNQSVLDKNDIQFSKSIELWMNPLNNPPFYSMRINPKTHYSLGGLVTNQKTQVLDLQGKIIPSLYAVGEVTGLTHGANRLGSCSITECLVMGKISGRKVLEI